jgi:hypothetical protein
VKRQPCRIDEVVEVLPPAQYAACGAVVDTERVDVQYQSDLPPVRAARNRLPRPRRRVSALRAARPWPRRAADPDPQVGPRALAWAAAWLHTGLGVPFAKVATILRTGFGLAITLGGLVQALHRVAARSAPTYQAFIGTVRQSRVVAPVETGLIGHNYFFYFCRPAKVIVALSLVECDRDAGGIPSAGMRVLTALRRPARAALGSRKPPTDCVKRNLAPR